VDVEVGAVRVRAVFTERSSGQIVLGPPKSLRRGNFNRQAGWPQAVAAIGARGLHFHDLRHTGNAWAATSGAGLRDLMARMGHDSERAAIIYQHQARGADSVITRAIDVHADAELRRDGGSPGDLGPPG
jgi:integrase